MQSDIVQKSPSDSLDHGQAKPIQEANQQEKEKLLDLEKKFSQLITDKAQDFANHSYGFEALDMIHEVVVKANKKELPIEILETLKSKKIDFQRNISTSYGTFILPWHQEPQVNNFDENRYNAAFYRTDLQAKRSIHSFKSVSDVLKADQQEDEKLDPGEHEHQMEEYTRVDMLPPQKSFMHKYPKEEGTGVTKAPKKFAMLRRTDGATDPIISPLSKERFNKKPMKKAGHAFSKVTGKKVEKFEGNEWEVIDKSKQSMFLVKNLSKPDRV